MISPDHDVRAARLREWLNTGLWFLPMVWALGSIVAAIVMTSKFAAGGWTSIKL